MSFSKAQKARFFSEVNHDLNLALSYFDNPENATKQKLLEIFENIERPFLWGNVKWAVKLHCGIFPTNEELKRASDHQSVYDNWVDYHRRAEAMYR